MKQFTIRAFVLTLALAGIAATSVSKASTPSKVKVAAMVEPGSSAPLCLPSDPSHCGLD